MRGHTLLELLISSGLLLLALALCGQLAVTGMRTKMATEDKNQVFRAATILLDEINREMLRADRVLLPPAIARFTNYGTDVHPGDPGVPPLVLRVETTPALVVGYRFDREERTVSRILYAPTFDPAVPGTHTPRFPPRVMANWVEDFSVRALDPQATRGAPTLQVDFKLATQRKDVVSPNLRLSTWSRLRYRR